MLIRMTPFYFDASNESQCKKKKKCSELIISSMEYFTDILWQF